MIKLCVENLAGGGLMERISDEIQKAVANCLDPNTEAKKPRTVSMTMRITPNKERDMADVSCIVSSKLQPAEALETTLFIGADPRTGEISAHERQTPSEMVDQDLLPGMEAAIEGKITVNSEMQ